MKAKKAKLLKAILLEYMQKSAISGGPQQAAKLVSLSSANEAKFLAGKPTLNKQSWSLEKERLYQQVFNYISTYLDRSSIAIHDSPLVAPKPTATKEEIKISGTQVINRGKDFHTSHGPVNLKGQAFGDKRPASPPANLPAKKARNEFLLNSLADQEAAWLNAVQVLSELKGASPRAQTSNRNAELRR